MVVVRSSTLGVKGRKTPVGLQQNCATPFGKSMGRYVQYHFRSLQRGRHAFHFPTTSRWDLAHARCGLFAAQKHSCGFLSNPTTEVIHMAQSAPHQRLRSPYVLVPLWDRARLTRGCGRHLIHVGQGTPHQRLWPALGTCGTGHASAEAAATT